MFSTPRFYRNFWGYTFSTPRKKFQASPLLWRECQDAIGGSAAPTINSQGNRFVAQPISHKEVTKRMEAKEDEWRGWNWRTEGYLMVNGAFFTPSGAEISVP
ncbi:putative pectate lyase [Helianthus debilis subsp. tardiflorus]